MKYEKITLGNLIKQINSKNKENIEAELLGINIEKYFMPSVANVVGTDMKTYKIISNNQFAYNPMHIGRDRKLPIALYQNDKKALVSPAYCVFEIKDKSKVIPEFLMLIFKQDNFDHYVWFHSDSSVRGSISFEDFCNLEVIVPTIEEQKQIIKEYNIIQNSLNNINNGNELIQSMISKTFLNLMNNIGDEFNNINLNEIFDFQEGPGIRNWQNVSKDGINYINIRCIQNNDIVLNNPNMISKEEANNKYNHFLLKENDLVISTSGTLGKWAIIQKSHLPLCLNTSVIRFTPKDINNYEFMFGYLTSNLFYSILKEEATGSAQVNFGPMHLNKIKIKMPHESILKNYSRTINKLIKKFLVNKGKQKILEKLKIVLISKINNERGI